MTTNSSHNLLMNLRSWKEISNEVLSIIMELEPELTHLDDVYCPPCRAPTGAAKSMEFGNLCMDVDCMLDIVDKMGCEQLSTTVAEKWNNYLQ